jgi:hypothetical protein
VAPRQYRKSDGESDYVFYPDAPDQPAGFAVGDWVTERVAWYDTGQVHMLLLIAFLVLFLGGAVASWVIARRLPADSLARRGLWLLTATAALNFAFLVIFFLVFQLVVSGNAGINFDVGMPAWLAALFFLPLLTSSRSMGSSPCSACFSSPGSITGICWAFAGECLQHSGRNCNKSSE